MVKVAEGLELVTVPKLLNVPPLLTVIDILLLEASTSAVTPETPTIVNADELPEVVVFTLPLVPAFRLIVVATPPSLLNVKLLPATGVTLMLPLPVVARVPAVPLPASTTRAPVGDVMFTALPL